MAELRGNDMNRDQDLDELLRLTSDETRSKQADAQDAEDAKGKDSPPDKSVDDVDIPDDELKQYLIQTHQNEISDKEDMGWNEMREYDLKAYYGIKDEYMQNFPYANASAYPVPITPVLLDTAHSMIDDLIWRDPNSAVIVTPISDEDIKKAKNLENLLNWQILNDIIDAKMEDSACNFSMLLHGTGYKKIIRIQNEKGEYQLRAVNVPIQNIFLPVDAKNPEPDNCEGVTQIIPLSSNDLRQRIAMGAYRNLDKITKGFLPQTTSQELIDRYKQEITGLDTTQRITRDTWYIAERYMTYYPRGSMKARELIVWFSPSTGDILRKIENKDKIRPFVDKFIYQNHGQSFHMSLPWKIKNIQEKANYTDKQATDGIDKAISPAGFYDASEKFNAKIQLRVPTAMYPMKNLNSIKWEPINISPILAQRSEIKELWQQAERATGFTDIAQGVSSGKGAKTLGQDVMRSQRSDLRFSRIVKIMNYHWKREVEKIYEYDDRYMPRATKIKVLGTHRYESIEKLFPREQEEGVPPEETGLGLTGKYDFGLANKSIDQQEKTNQKRTAFYGSILSHEIFGKDPGNAYRALEQQAYANDINDFPYVVKKPKEASEMTPDELIARIMDGDDVQPNPDGDHAAIASAFRIYMRSGNFKDAKPEVQKKLAMFLMIEEKMQQAAVLAFQDFNITEGLKKGLNLGAGGVPPTPAANASGASLTPSPAPTPPPIPAPPQGGK
jgi:hypothetical protein